MKEAITQWQQFSWCKQRIHDNGIAVLWFGLSPPPLVLLLLGQINDAQKYTSKSTYYETLIGTLNGNSKLLWLDFSLYCLIKLTCWWLNISIRLTYFLSWWLCTYVSACTNIQPTVMKVAIPAPATESLKCNWQIHNIYWLHFENQIAYQNENITCMFLGC